MLKHPYFAGRLVVPSDTHLKPYSKEMSGLKVVCYLASYGPAFWLIVECCHGKCTWVDWVAPLIFTIILLVGLPVSFAIGYAISGFAFSYAFSFAIDY